MNTPLANTNINAVINTFRRVTDTLDALGVKHNADTDIVATEAHLFIELEVPVGALFCTLYADGHGTVFTVDVRHASDGEPIPAFGEVVVTNPNPLNLLGAILTSAEKARLGEAIN